MILSYQTFAGYFKKVHWSLLLFLVLVLNVKILVKLAAVILFLVLNRKLFYEKAIYRQKFIWFYFIMAGIVIVGVLMNLSSFSFNYLITAAAGVVFWLMCAACAALIYHFVSQSDLHKLDNTVILFFLLNTAVTLVQLMVIMWDAGSINPYTFQGMHQKYFTTTGDRMTGITFDMSTTNAILNAFGVLYFLYTGKIHMTLICMATMLLTVSNFGNILFLLVLLFSLAFWATKNQKSIIVVCMIMLVIFMAKISPQNENYMKEAFEKMAVGRSPVTAIRKDNTPLAQRPDSILSPEQRKKKTAMLFLDSMIKANQTTITPPETPKPALPQPDIHSAPFQFVADTSALQRNLLHFAIRYIPDFDTSLRSVKNRRTPGKVIAFEQIFSHVKKHPLTLIAGSGAGNYSSKLAFRSSGLQIAGGYPAKYTYIHNDFLHNHLALYLTYYTKHQQLHSVINYPNSVYFQLIAEYGVIGIAAFLIFYVYFFFRHSRKRSFALPLLLMLLGILAIEYWYEQLSIVILFELLMLIHIKTVTSVNE